MLFSRLSWRLGAPILLLVLLETVAVVAYMSWQIAAEDRLRLLNTAERMATFMGGVSVQGPRSGFAPTLSRLTGLEVFVREEIVRNFEELDPTLARQLLAVPVDGGVHMVDGTLVVAAPMGDKGVLLLRSSPSQALTDPRLLQVLTAFWLLALLTTSIALRRLGRPLRELAAQIPQIDHDGPLELSAVQRPDEIGDVARAYQQTRSALLAERESRQRAEKQAVLGRMTAALAHEVQNPVAAIRMHAQLLRGVGFDPARDLVADTIIQEASRIESLLNQWLFLTRPEPPALGDVDLNSLLTEVVRMQRPRADHAAVHIELVAPPRLALRADGKRLQHVFHNLIDNAVQAMPTGGTLTITARSLGAVAEVVFADQGRGFSEQALQRFAEFFFSEKEGGMGIGLSVAAEIAKAHGGSLLAANRPGGGAEVTVVLPLAPATPTA